MKILYHHRIRTKDGQYVHLEELSRALRELGHEIVLVGPTAIEKEDFGADAGFIAHLKRHLPKRLYELLEFAYSILAYLRLRAAIRRHRPDCIYERYNLFQIAGAWARHTNNLPMLLEVNAPLLEERQQYGGVSSMTLANWSQNYVWRSADYLLPVTEVLAGYLRRSGVPDSRIVVIPNGVDLERFQRVTDRAEAKRHLGLEGRLVLGFTGFVREWHGLESVIDLIARDEAKVRPHLLLVGDGPARKGVEEHARRLGVEGSVTITGVIPREQIANYIAAFDIALQPSVVPYASPLKLFEYMALGCAIVAPCMPNLREVLSDDENALLFDPEITTSFSRAVYRLLLDADLRTRIGAAAARTIVDKKLTWKNNAQRVLTLFERLRIKEESSSRASTTLT
jgi:glycosyltransferase involved in cell wall biosynthesis